MRKPTMLYASPFPPQQSGISDYSTYMAPALQEFFDVTLYTGDYKLAVPELRENFPVIRHGVDEVRFEAYDHLVYQIGNNPWYHGYIYEACLRHPGLVILHEFVIYYLVVGLYRDRPDFYSRLYEIGGAPAISAVKAMAKEGTDLLRFSRPEELPLCRELLLSGNRIAAHCEYTRGRAQAETNIPVSLIHLAQGEPRQAPRRSRQEVLAELDIPQNAVVIGSLGFIAATKLNHLACRAVSRLHREGRKDVYYLMIGEGDYVNSYLDGPVRITGYVPEDRFDAYLDACDLILNLRYPTMGETSASLLRAMQFSKPCIITDVGWFSELPGDAVLKLGAESVDLIEEQIYQALDIFLSNRRPFVRMAQVGAAYVRQQHSPAGVAREIHRILTEQVPQSKAFYANPV